MSDKSVYTVFGDCGRGAILQVQKLTSTAAPAAHAHASSLVHCNGTRMDGTASNRNSHPTAGAVAAILIVSMKHQIKACQSLANQNLSKQIHKHVCKLASVARS